MLPLLCAVICSSLISLLMRFSEPKIKSNMYMFTANYVVCTALGIYLNWGTRLNMGQTAFAAFAGLLSGFFFLGSFLLLQLNIKKNGVVLSSTFMRLGVVVPTLMAIFIFHEKMTWNIIAGFVLVLIAILMIQGVFEKSAFKAGLWLLLLLLAGGLTDSLVNVYDKLGVAHGKDLYLTITFATAGLLSLFIGIGKGQKFHFMDIVWGALIGVPNFFSSRFLMQALRKLSAVFVYPAYNALVIGIITLVGICGFKEKLSTRKVIGLVAMAIALILLNI